MKNGAGKPRGEIPLGRLKRRWENNIITHLKEIGANMRNWIDSAQDRDHWRTLMNVAFNLRVLSVI